MVGRPVGVPRTRRRTPATGEGWVGRGPVGCGVDGDGYPRGKQFLLIQRSHPQPEEQAWWTRSWTSLLLAPSFFRPFSPGLSRPSLFLFLAARANLASANKCSSVLATLSMVIRRHSSFYFLSDASAGLPSRCSSSIDSFFRTRSGSIICSMCVCVCVCVRLPRDPIIDLLNDSNYT